MDSERHGPAREPAEVPGAYLIKVAADATAMTARVRAALDGEAAARAKAAADEFSAAAEKLRTAPGESRQGLATLAAGILGISAARKLEEVNGEAAELARTTQFGYADWLDALVRIGGHPRRDAILGVLRDAAASIGANPRLLARDLADSGILGDRGLRKPAGDGFLGPWLPGDPDERPAVWERTLRRCEQEAARVRLPLP